MRWVRVLTLLTVICWTAPSAQAQIGLYASPEMINLPPIQSGDAFAPGDARYPPPDYAAPFASAYSGYPEQTAAAEPRRLRRRAAQGPPREAPEGPPSVVDQMLSEWQDSERQPPGVPDTGCDPAGSYGCLEGCAPSAPCLPSNWYVSVSGLIMGRDGANKVWVTYQDNRNENQLMHTQHIGLDWRGGGEVRFGRRFCCGKWALEAAYWTLDNFSGFASQTHAAGVSTPLMFLDVVYANRAIAGTPRDLFFGAEEHRLWRENELHNVELNLIHNPLGSDYLVPIDIDWLVGVRFFRFDEDLLFGSLRQDGVAFGVDPKLEGYLDDHIENKLVGAQFGCDLNYRRGNWRLFLLPRVGIYNNRIRHRFSGYRGDGELFDVVPAGYPSYPVESTDDGVSFLTEIDVGLEWQFAARLSAQIGYRTVIVTGIGLADHQIPPYVVDTPELADIDRNGDLVLHGAFAGLTFRF